MRFKANGEAYDFDEASITFGEARSLEEVTGMTMEDIGSGGISALQALIWIAVARVHPDVQYDDLDAWKISDVEIEDDTEGEDPTSGE